MRILIAEDDQETARFLRRGLEELGHNPVVAVNGVDALHLLTTEEFDVAVIDRMMPAKDGLSVVHGVRAANIELPVLLLTALGRIEDRVAGLEAGADDYLVKPFSFSELAARVNAITRRRTLQPELTRIEEAGVVVDLLGRRVTRDGTKLILQPREFKILVELMRESGKVVTRTMLLERVWQYHFEPRTNIVETHISRLRAKLNEGDKPNLIETVRGAGYRFASDAH